MASIHKQKGKPFWFVSYRTPNGKQHFRSTGTIDEAQARAVAAAVEKTGHLARADRLTADTARTVIQNAVEDVLLASTAEPLARTTVRAFCDVWLGMKRVETAPTTVTRYEGILRRFYDYLGRNADRDIATVRGADVIGFRDKLAGELSRNSANLAVKVLRGAFGAALRQGLVTGNAADAADTLKVRAESQRRPFTLAEIQKLLAVARGTEMEGLILTGLYTSARLGDVARLTWRAVKLDGDPELTFIVGKTGERQTLPLVKPLADYFESLPSTDDPNAFVFPKSAEAAKRVGTLSNEFHALLVEAGLAKPRTKKNTGRGRNASRPVGELSFHCLRHSAVSFLKRAGVSEPLAMAIAGHKSTAVSAVYTHYDKATLRGVLAKLPNVTKKGGAR
jgi:integrase